MQKNTILIIITSLIAVSAKADTTIKQKSINEIAQQYINSIACTKTIEKKQITQQIYKLNDKNKPGYDDYLVHWIGDIGCNGSNNSHNHYLTHIYRNNFSKFIANHESYSRDILNAQATNNLNFKPLDTRLIKNITVKNSIIEVVSNEVSEINCPSCSTQNYKYTIFYNGKEKPYIIDRQPVKDFQR